MSNAPRKTDPAAKDGWKKIKPGDVDRVVAEATAPKAKKQRPPSKETKRPKRGGRAKGAEQTPEAKTDRYVAATAVGEHSHSARTAAGKQRMARLHELFDSKSEDMMQVMHDIAMDKAVHASVRLDAADRFLNRLHGKPKEHVHLTDDVDGAGATDEVMTLLGNIFEAVGLPPLLENKGSPTLDQSESSPTSSD